MKKLIALVFIALMYEGYAQNLVANPSFEVTNTNCSQFGGESFRQDLDPVWDNANSNIPGDSCSSPDLFSACNTILGGPGPTFMPDATSFGIGYQYSRTGTRHVGLIAYSAPFGFEDNYREYIQGQTTAPLTAGVTYCVSFYVSLADGSPWGVSDLGVYFSNSRYLRDACTQGSRINETPQLVNTCGVILDTTNWVRLQWDYVATGGEQYFVIGNFNSDAGTTKAPAQGTGFGNYFAYYFIDDFSIVENTCCYAEITGPTSACEADGAFAISVTGGDCITPVTGTWSGTGITDPVAGTFDPSLVGSGNHTVTFTSSCGYVATAEISVSPCALDVCIEANGDLTASGGAEPYSWQEEQTTQDCSSCVIGCNFPPGCAVNVTGWSTFTTGTTISDPGTYPIQVVDNTGATFLINSLADLSPCSTDPPCPQINVAISNQSDVSCNGANDGAATVSATGGSGPYTYTWVPGNITGATQTGLSPQTYTVSVEDANNCPGSVQVTIAEPSALSANAVATDACDNTGTASASPSGGTGPYTYSWSTGETTSSISNLAPGGYTVTVTDANSCTVQQTVTVYCTGCPTITVTESSHTDVTCNGANDGAATVVASGGNAPYSYTWNPGGMTGGSQTGLSPQTYTVVAEDADGCTGTIQVVITESTVMTAITSSVDASCGINDGQATVNVSGGTGPYNYVWTPNVGTTASVSGLSAGVYSVVVTDANGCQLTETINVNNQNAPTATITSVSDETCLGAANGSATVSATGGSGNYTYAWSPSGGTSATATGLATGTYTVTVTDDSGCITSINVTIGAGSVITVTASVTDEDCGVANGAIDLSVSGGSGNYTYVWSSGEVTQDISGVSTGEYEVIVTDDAGCSTTETITVGVIGELFVTVVPPVATIDAGESVQLEASGGYTYTWTPEEGLSCTDCPDPIASPMVTTTYVVTAIDENGCAGDTTVVIFVENVCGEIFVPTIFSPNDDGNNDEHCVMGDCVQEFELSIYNRWGERVFISDNQANCWDGIFRGKPVQTGVYVYKLRVRLVDGTEVIDSGNINVVR